MRNLLDKKCTAILFSLSQDRFVFYLDKTFHLWIYAIPFFDPKANDRYMYDLANLFQ
jgi:hypothetical protein